MKEKLSHFTAREGRIGLAETGSSIQIFFSLRIHRQHGCVWPTVIGEVVASGGVGTEQTPMMER